MESPDPKAPNFECLHCAINSVTPDQRHRGKDEEILVKRKQVYRLAKSAHSEKWCETSKNGIR